MLAMGQLKRMWINKFSSFIIWIEREVTPETQKVIKVEQNLCQDRGHKSQSKQKSYKRESKHPCRTSKDFQWTELILQLHKRIKMQTFQCLEWITQPSLYRQISSPWSLLRGKSQRCSQSSHLSQNIFRYKWSTNNKSFTWK